jgi:hypothetical protein
MYRIFVKRTSFRRYHLLKTALPCNAVLWDRRVGETVYRRRNERRRVPPDTWNELDFVTEAPPVVIHDEPVEPPDVQSRTLFRLADTLVGDIVDRLRTPRRSPMTESTSSAVRASDTTHFC